jgi:hypothetical protein
MNEHELTARPDQAPTHYVSGRHGARGFGRPTNSLAAAEQIARSKYTEGYRNLQIHCYATGSTTRYRHQRSK